MVVCAIRMDISDIEKGKGKEGKESMKKGSN